MQKEKKRMKKLTRRMVMGLMACAAVLAFLPGAAGQEGIPIGNDKDPKSGKAPIMAITKEGTTWVAGKVKFKIVDDTLEVSIDLDSGVPSASVQLQTETIRDGVLLMPPAQGIRTDERGDVKYTEVYGITTKDPFQVWVNVFVEGSEVTFTSQLDPVTVGMQIK
jgi:hypothetical protein